MSDPLRDWFAQRGYMVFCEVCRPYGGGPLDMVAWADPVAIVVEMKVNATRDLLRQATTAQILTPWVYAAVTSRPRPSSVALFQRYGIGVLRVTADVEVVLDARGKFYGIRQSTPVFENRLRQLDAAGWDGVGRGGLPTLLGDGPAQECWGRAEVWRRAHPRATWAQTFRAVSNHYASAQSMSGSMGKLEAFIGYAEMCRRQGIPEQPPAVQTEV